MINIELVVDFLFLYYNLLYRNIIPLKDYSFNMDNKHKPIKILFKIYQYFTTLILII